MKLTNKELQDLLLDAAERIEDWRRDFCCEAIEQSFRQIAERRLGKPRASFDRAEIEGFWTTQDRIIATFATYFRPWGVRVDHPWWGYEWRLPEVRQSRVLVLLLYREIVRTEAISHR